MGKIGLLSCVWTAAVVGVLGAQPPDTATFRMAAPLIRQAPQIDGTIEEAEWRGAVRNVDLIDRQGVATARAAVFWLGCDGKELYLALKTEAPPDGRLLTRAVPDVRQDVVAAFYDDSIELVLDPRRERAPGDRTFYHVISNARGALFDWAVDPDNRQSPKDLNWRLPAWKLAEKLADGWWHVEASIPLASLAAAEEDLAQTWGVRIGRNWQRPFQQCQSGTQGGSYDDQTTMPQVRWILDAPVVRVLSTHGDGKKPRIEVALFNPQDKPTNLRARLSDAWHRDPPQESASDVTLGPGQEEIVALDCRDGGPEGLHATSILVTSADGRQTYYRRAWKWSLHRPETVWTIAEEQRQAVGLEFKYYPSYAKIGFRLSTESLASRDRVTGAEALLWRSDDQGKPQGEPLWRRPVSLRQHVAEEMHEIPRLEAGKYAFGIRLAGGDGVPGEPVVQPFVRKVFPWENNQLGISREVMPPFTPLEVEGNRVRVVLREHRHGSGGLWESVVVDALTPGPSPGKGEGGNKTMPSSTKGEGREELLAGPMRWEVTAAGPDGRPATAAVSAEAWKYTARQPTEVIGQCRWTAGPLAAEVRTEYDYDGMMLVRVGLAPTPSPIQRLSLAIPLRAEVARYMHAVGDGLRHNYAGLVPPGEGRVWDSSKASRLEIPGTFFP